MKSEISFVGKMTDYIFKGEQKKSKVMTFCDMKVLYKHTKFVFYVKLSFSTQLALIEKFVFFTLLLIFIRRI